HTRSNAEKINPQIGDGAYFWKRCFDSKYDTGIEFFHYSCGGCRCNQALDRAMRIIALFIAYFLLITVSHAQSANILTLADIHFDPFIYCKAAPCPIIDKLRATDVSGWPVLFKHYSSAMPAINQNSNYALVKSALDEAAQIAASTQSQ